MTRTNPGLAVLCTAIAISVMLGLHDSACAQIKAQDHDHAFDYFFSSTTSQHLSPENAFNGFKRAGAQEYGLYGGKTRAEDKARMDKAYDKEIKAVDDALEQAKKERDNRVKNCHDEDCKRRAQEIYDIREQVLETKRTEIEARYKEAQRELKKYWDKREGPGGPPRKSPPDGPPIVRPSAPGIR